MWDADKVVHVHLSCLGTCMIHIGYTLDTYFHECVVTEACCHGCTPPIAHAMSNNYAYLRELMQESKKQQIIR